MILCASDKTVVVKLPSGEVLSIADLPSANLRRWTASRKIIVVRAVIHRLITQTQALERYSLSEEEFLSWVSLYHDHGVDGLKTTKVKKYRQL